jgi:hypothetical protein
MAKKKPREFKLLPEVRKLLRVNPELTSRQVEELLRKKFPRQQRINSKSCTQAVSVSRLTLGIRSSYRGRDDPEISRHRAAKQFVDQIGDIQRAIGILQQLADLQTNESRD